MKVESIEKRENGEESDGIDFMQWFVLSLDSPLLMLFKPIHILACMLSSYIYIWFTAFGDDGRLKLQIVIEAQFLFDMLLNFLTEYVQDGETEPVRDLSRISKRYLKQEFLSDLIPLLPLPFLVGTQTRIGRLLYLLKLFRLK